MQSKRYLLVTFRKDSHFLLLWWHWVSAAHVCVNENIQRIAVFWTPLRSNEFIQNLQVNTAKVKLGQSRICLLAISFCFQIIHNCSNFASLYMNFLMLPLKHIWKLLLTGVLLRIIIRWIMWIRMDTVLWYTQLWGAIWRSSSTCWSRGGAERSNSMSSV